MKYKIILSSLLLFVLTIGQVGPWQSITQANDPNYTEIDGLRITLNGDNVYINWDRLNSDQEKALGGYAVAWGTRQSEVRINEYARQYIDNYTDNMTVRLGTFERNDDYYFRIFGYDEDNKYNHLYGSKILKWSYSGSGNTESETIEPEDPVIVDNSSDNDSNDEAVYEFGELRATEFDTIVRFFWSAPNLTSNEYDDVIIVISEKSDLSDPILEASVGTDLLKARIDGLKPDTQYHAAGYFEKNGRRFGKSDTINVKTLPEADSTGKRRLQRLLDSIGQHEGFGTIIDAQQHDDNAVSTTTTTSTTSSNTSSSNTTTSTYRPSSSNFVVPDNSGDINDELRRIRREMGTLEVQKRKLILKLREIQS